MGELLARVRALLRRRNVPANSEKSVPNLFDYDDGYLKIDFRSNLTIVANHEIKLTPIESKLLRELVKNIRVGLEYDDLLNRVWGLEYQGARSYLHDYINSLRHKIEPDMKNPQYIINIFGRGYRFDKK
jgi:DNA-binding response OmpR family regulator